jgi:cell division protein FtsZ
MEHLIARVAARAGRKRAENARAQAARAGGRRILVVGVGSAGCSAAEWVFEETPEAATVTVNTDRLSLEIHKSETKVLLGARIFRGHGAQGHIDAARRAARETLDQITELVRGFDIVVVLTALGGGTGTGATPVVAAAARKEGAAVVVVAALPMRAERSRRERALAALPDLKREAHTTILLDNEALLPIAGHLPVGTALGVMDYFMAEVPRALVRSVELSEAREVAQREARELVLAGGIGTVVYGEWHGEGDSARAQHALVEPAGGSPNGALIHISSGDGRALIGAEDVLAQIAARLKSDRPPAARVRLSVAADPAIQNGGSLVSVVTGIADPCARRSEAPAVTIEPSRVVEAPAVPPAREVEGAPAAVPSVDVTLRTS